LRREVVLQEQGHHELHRDLQIDRCRSKDLDEGCDTLCHWSTITGSLIIRVGPIQTDTVNTAKEITFVPKARSPLVNWTHKCPWLYAYDASNYNDDDDDDVQWFNVHL